MTKSCEDCKCYRHKDGYHYCSHESMQLNMRTTDACGMHFQSRVETPTPWRYHAAFLITISVVLTIAIEAALTLLGALQ